VSLPLGAFSARGPIAIGLALLFAGAAAPLAAERKIQVMGRITGPDGNGMPGMSVRLFKTRRAIELPKFTSGGQIAEAVRVSTDDSGYYQIDVPRDRAYDNYYLRFYDPSTFDAVRYAPPGDREITKDLKRGEALTIDVQIATRPEWPEIERRIEQLGADSPKGKLLRTLGIPEHETNGTGPDGPREEWWYHTRGVVYFFRDGKAAGMRQFEPLAPGAPAAKVEEAAAHGGG
jgi:hypothetical protein